MGAQPGGEAAAWRLRDSLFHYRFCCRLTADRYRFDLILFDCLKGQKIGLTFLQPKFEQKPSLCASILGITRKSYGLPEHKAKRLCVISQIAHTFVHVSRGSQAAWERLGEAQTVLAAQRDLLQHLPFLSLHSP